MGLSFGQLASGAGAVGAGMDQAQARQQTLRQDQLAVEAQNREDAIRQQAAQRAQQSGGLKIPDVMQFAGGQGGQNYVGSLGIPVPAPTAPQAPPMQQQPATTDVRVVEVSPPVQPQSGAQMQPQTGSPVSRYLDQRKERVALLDQVNAKYRSNAGLTGLFANQTDAQRNDAKNIMDQYEKLDNAQLKELLATGKLPAAPATGARPEMKASMRTTESSNNPNAVSPKGATGLMQVMPATAMDPGFNLPNVFDFARQQGVQVNGSTKEEAERLLKIPSVGGGFGNMYTDAMSQRYGGNEILMLAAYNMGPGATDKWIQSGRDPANLPEETRDYIIKNFKIVGNDKPFIGDKPAKTADNVAAAVAAPATSGVMYGQNQVSGGGNPNIQAAVTLRQLTVARAQDYYRLGMSKELNESVAQVAAIDLGLYRAQADQGVAELSTTGDAGRAMAVLSQFTGTPHQALSRGDGTYDLYVSGKVTQTALSTDKLADIVKTRVDAEYRAQKVQLSSTQAAKMMAANLELRNSIQVELVKAQGNLQKAIVDGKFRVLEKEAERQGGKLTVDTSNGVAYLQTDGQTFIVDPRATTNIRGKEVSTPTARPIAGLNQ
jgi:soluble lytic murein transglycosylase-like protein